MAIQFRKATKEQSRLRLSIAGPAGSGKTYSALKIATEMSALTGGKIAVIDTERGSASKYSDIFAFDVLELDDFHPESYVEAIKAAEKAGYDILILDSTTHEWNGKNGILELHEAAIQRQRVKNSFTAWADVTPLHNKFIDAILQCKCHVIASVRSKTDYVQDKDQNGRTEVRKVGMAAIRRDSDDYEYDIAIELDLNHNAVISKTRCAALDGKVFKKPGRELAEILVAWLSDGAEPAPATPEPVKQPKPQPEPKAPARTAYDEAVDSIIDDMKKVYLSGGNRNETEWEIYRKGLLKKTPDELETMLGNWQRAAEEKAKAA